MRGFIKPGPDEASLFCLALALLRESDGDQVNAAMALPTN
jgi:hypothetical protein